MIYFFADDHYDAHCGKRIFENLPSERRAQIAFFENDWTLLESDRWLNDCELLILNLIGGTCGQPHPSEAAEKAVRSWCERGGNILLLHGSSAAFWQWQWWREIVGLRWVRPADPDGVAPSVHPVEPYSLRLCKVRHKLAEKLIPFAMKTDEIYTALEQVSPVVVLMETEISQGVFPQCFEAISPWGGKLLSFLPGHDPEVSATPLLVENIDIMINYLLKAK